MEYRHLRIERDPPVTVVTFDRPEKLNALNARLMHEILHAAEAFHEDEATRVVIFTGAGPSFSAGVDLGDPEGIARLETASDLMKSRWLQLGPRMIQAIYHMDQITIAAVNGMAAGGGACIAAACDFRVGAEDCRVGYPEVKLGMNLSWLALPMCVRLIGPARTKRMVILAEMERAETLLEWRYLDRIVPKGRLLEETKEMARAFAARPAMAAQMVKRSVNAIASALDQAIMHMDADQFLLTLKTEDYQRAIAEFLRRKDRADP